MFNFKLPKANNAIMTSQKVKLALFACIIFLSVGCDRVTKELAREHLSGKAGISYWNNTFRLEYVENSGAAMSLGADWSPWVKKTVLIALPTLILLGLLGYALKNAALLTLPQLLAVGLIFSGGAGNIYDRIFNNHLVPDFMNLGYERLRTGIFNVADVCVTVGIVMLLVFSKKTG